MPTNKERARWAVKNAWRRIKISHPKTLLCVFCYAPAVEYHHHLGYAKKHWLDILPVCRKCHFAHDEAKQRILKTNGLNPFSKKYNLMKAFIAANQAAFDKFCNN